MGREGTTTRWVRFLRGLFSLWACSSRCRPFYLVSGCTSGASLPDETSARHLVSPHHTSYPPHQPACPTEPLHASEVDATTVRVQAWTDRNGHRNLQTAAPIPIPVYVTYISPPNTTPFNPVEQRYFEIAVNLLNRDFQSTPFVFRLERFHAVDAPQWRACPFASPSTAAMTQALHQGGTDALNVYVCRPAAFSGWSTLPQWLDLDFWDRRQDGIVLAEQAVVGVGNPSWRNTLTHEVGHWLGLFHTFENGCRAPGDGVNDTAAVAQPSYSCNGNTNTCPDDDPTIDAGVDPLENWMDYTHYGNCANSFTPGQITRMVAMFEEFRTLDPTNHTTDPVVVNNAAPVPSPSTMAPSTDHVSSTNATIPTTPPVPSTTHTATASPSTAPVPATMTTTPTTVSLPSIAPTPLCTPPYQFCNVAAGAVCCRETLSADPFTVFYACLQNTCVPAQRKSRVPEKDGLRDRAVDDVDRMDTSRGATPTVAVGTIRGGPRRLRSPRDGV
jgi:hypothetical protein